VGIEPPPPESVGLFARHWRTDVRDGEALAAVIAEASPAAIVHLAGQSSAGRSFQQPIETFRVNALGTLALLEAVRSAGARIRVLVVGTGEVYGSLPAGSRAAESAPFRPVSPYALSKAAADAIAEFHSRHGVDVVRTRSFGHIGTGQAPIFVVPSIAQQIARIETGGAEPAIRVGNLDVTRDFTDVRDVVEAYLALLDRGRSGAAYNVCRGEGTALADLVEAMRAQARAAVRIEVDPDRLRPADIPYLVGDPSAIERDTGWKAVVPLERTLGEILEEWRSRVGTERTR
jgi:GDP-4-dehydro-6-deoxy-D-mannose reductase